MSVDISKIRYPVLQNLKMQICIPNDHFLIRLEQNIPWVFFAELAINDLYKDRKKSGPKLNLRLHIGAYLLQSMFKWTDRELEENLNFYAPAKLFCGIDGRKSYDHTAYVKFRNRITEDTAKQFSHSIIKVAAKKGFTNGSALDFDSTVQEANIEYPSDVRMMHKLVNKSKKLLEYLKEKGIEKAEDILNDFGFKKIGKKLKEYYFAKKNDKGHEKKVEIFSYIQRKTKEITETVSSLFQDSEEDDLKWNFQKHLTHIKDVAPILLKQIRHFIANQRVATNKILALHIDEAKCICKGKVGKVCEFGRKWFVGRLSGNYAFGFTDEDIALEDSYSLEKGIREHEKIFNCPPESLTGDQGFWSRPNLKICKEKEIEEIGISPRGRLNWLVDFEKIECLKSRRAGVEPIIGHIKRRGLGKSKMKSDNGTKVEGQRAVLSLNLSRLAKDLHGGDIEWTG